MQFQILEIHLTWYKNKKSGLEKDFIESVRNQFKLNKLFPLSYPIKYKNYRTSLIHRFPFIIYYEIDVNINVYAVLHTSRELDKRFS